jgi:hypothetical protein
MTSGARGGGYVLLRRADNYLNKILCFTGFPGFLIFGCWFFLFQLQAVLTFSVFRVVFG